MIVTVHKIPSCFVICTAEFLNHVCLRLYANSAVLLHFVLTMPTNPFTVQLEPAVVLEMSPIWYQFRQVFPQLTLVLRLLVFCLEWSLMLLESILRACGMLPYLEQHGDQETFVRIYDDIFCNFNTCIISKIWNSPLRFSLHLMTVDACIPNQVSSITRVWAFT